MSVSRIGAGLSTLPDMGAAVREACAAAIGPLRGARPSLLVVFASADHWRHEDRFATALAAAANPERMIGSMGEAIIGAGREVSVGPALSVLAAWLPQAIVTTSHLRAEPSEHGHAVVGELPTSAWRGNPSIVLADPFTFPADQVIAELEDRGVVAVGGLASGGHAPGEHRLLIDGRVVDEGAVIATIAGVGLRTVVSQGCTAIGPEMVVTDAEGSVVRELAGQPALSKLESIVEDLPASERTLATEGLLAGLVIDENKPDYGRGDYLMRGVLGADRETGDLMFGERVRVGQTMRFHVRDASSASEDLRSTLDTYRGSAPPATGVLVFSCNGRGRRMFNVDDHDARIIDEVLGSIPTAGMFCNGEIGPVGSRNFLHAFTATMAVFGEEGSAPADEVPAD